MYQRYSAQVEIHGPTKRRQKEVDKRLQHSVPLKSKDKSESSDTTCRKFVKIAENAVPSRTTIHSVDVFITSPTNQGVGLSSLLNRMVHQKFSPEHPKSSDTFVFLKSKSTADFVKIQFLTQDAVKSPEEMPKIILILFDLTTAASLDEVKKPETVTEISSFTKPSDGPPKTTCILVGCKADLVRQRQISFCTAATLALKIGAIYVESSSRTGNAVDDLLDTIGFLAMESAETSMSSSLRKEFTVALVGPVGVGKTSLRKSLTSQSQNYNSGVLECKVDEEESNVIVWDAGSSKQTVLSPFVKKAQVILFIYDVTNSKSLEELKALYCFVKEIHDASEVQCTYMWVGNKTDLVEQIQVSDKVSEELVGASYKHHYRISSTRKSDIDKLRRKIIKSLEKSGTTSKPSHNYDVIVKTILIGDCNVGKTCLMKSIVENSFDEKYSPTFGVDFGTIIVDNRETGSKIKLQMWDTSGNEKNQSLNRTYVRGAASIAVVFDVTNKKSFEGIAGWFEEAEKYTLEDDLHMILVGAKCDASNRQVSHQEAEEFAKTKNIPFLEVSSKTKSGIQEVTQAMIRSSFVKPQQKVESVAKKPQFDVMAKVVFVGDVHVGKTSLCRLLQGLELTDKYTSTIGAAFGTTSFDCDDGSKAEVQLWDTAGQERFQSLSANYYRGTSTVVLVYDVNVRKTFENVKNVWMQQVNDYCVKETKLILVANKMDAESRVVSKDEGRAFAESVGAFYFELGGKDTADVEELKKELVPYEDDDDTSEQKSESDMLLARLQVGTSDIRVALLGEPDVYDKSMLLVRMDSNSLIENKMKKKKRIPRKQKVNKGDTDLQQADLKPNAQEVDVVAQLTDEQPDRVTMTWLPSHSETDVALIPFDLSSLNSLAAAQRVASKVMNLVSSETAEKSPKVVLLGTEDVNSDRVIPREDAEQLAESLGVVYQEILAGDDPEQVTFTIRNLVIDEQDNWEEVGQTP